MFNSLPKELHSSLLNLTDPSTKVSLRLTCAYFNALLPRKPVNKNDFYAQQCCEDGNYQLFLLALEWKQPLLCKYYTAAARSNCMEIIMFLKEQGLELESRDKVFAKCVIHDNKEMFEYLHQEGFVYDFNLIRVPNRVWFGKYEYNKNHHLGRNQDLNVHYNNILMLKLEISTYPLTKNNISECLRLDRREILTWFITTFPNNPLVDEDLLLKFGDSELFSLVLQQKTLDLDYCLGHAMCFLSYEIFNICAQRKYKRVFNVTSGNILDLFLLIPDFVPGAKILNEAIFIYNNDTVQFFGEHFPSAFLALVPNSFSSNNRYKHGTRFTIQTLNVFYKLRKNWFNEVCFLNDVLRCDALPILRWLIEKEIDCRNVSIVYFDSNIEALRLLDSNGYNFDCEDLFYELSYGTNSEVFDFICDSITDDLLEISRVDCFNFPAMRWWLKKSGSTFTEKLVNLLGNGDYESIVAWLEQ
jgi:hypothetical protein